MGQEPIRANSKCYLNKSVLKKITEKVIKNKVSDFSFYELSGGLCNAVYMIENANKRYVVKVAPPIDTVMMRHERNIIETEAEMLKKINSLEILVPELILYDTTNEICEVPYFVMSYLEGSPLMTIKDNVNEEELAVIKFQLGKMCKKISSIKGTYFGIPAMKETHFDNNADFILTLIDLLLKDANDKNIEIPYIEPKNLIKLINGYRECLNKVENPYLIHTDTWEGNIMVKNSKMTGLIDFAAMLYGDPLMNHDFHDFSPKPNQYFLKGYGKEKFTKNEWTRIIIYKIWQRLGMIVERKFRGYEDSNIYSWVLDEFVKEVKELEKTFIF